MVEYIMQNLVVLKLKKWLRQVCVKFYVNFKLFITLKPWFRFVIRCLKIVLLIYFEVMRVLKYVLN